MHKKSSEMQKCLSNYSVDFACRKCSNFTGSTVDDLLILHVPDVICFASVYHINMDHMSTTLT